MEPTSNKTPRRGEFFILEAGTISGPRCGVTFTNLERLLSPPRLILLPAEGGMPLLREIPRLRFDPSDGPPPKDLEPGFSGYWLVSKRLHDAMASIDPSAFAFTEVDYLIEGGIKGEVRYLCTVVSVIDALDEAASTLLIDTSEEFINGKFYDLSGGASVTFDRSKLGNAHVFRTPYTGTVFCDLTFREAVAAAGMAVDSDADGLWFIDASDI
ncbi:imm11 family protein [Stenotrophomonas maltophilia]|uniref:imm11 family protein n=1 Tax=Stenotrophomonas maltophilia TaxID=40324 RepID=UPI0039F66C4F